MFFFIVNKQLHYTFSLFKLQISDCFPAPVHVFLNEKTMQKKPFSFFVKIEQGGFNPPCSIIINVGEIGVFLLSVRDDTVRYFRTAEKTFVPVRGIALYTVGRYCPFIR